MSWLMIAVYNIALIVGLAIFIGVSGVEHPSLGCMHCPAPIPTPIFAAGDCFTSHDHEPWEAYVDGQVLQVGKRHYLAVTRIQRNSNDRYDGNREYGYMVTMDATQDWVKVPCPKGWKH